MFFFLAVSSMAKESPTFDEQFHLYSGYSYLFLLDSSIGLAQPPLARLLAAIPLAVTNNHNPPRELWAAPLPRYSDYSTWWQYEAAQDFYYGLSDPAKALFWSRFVMVLVGAALAALVYKWSVEAFGFKAGVLALVFCILDPNLLAHARLVNTDVAATLGIFAAVYFMWCYSRAASRKWLLASAAAAGAAILSKYSALVVLPMLSLLVLVNVLLQMRVGSNVSGLRVAWRASRDLATFFAVVLVVIWICYLPDLSSQFQRPSSEEFSEAMRIDPSGHSRILSARSLPFPSHFLQGLMLVIAQQKHPPPAFLMGKYSSGGWWQYFPTCFLIKTPIPLMVALGLFFYLASRRKLSVHAAANLYLILPPVFIFGSSMASDLNIGIRHILPIYPFLFVLAGGIASSTFANRIAGKLVVAALCLWSAFASIRIYPHYLAYFNELIGGPENGYRYLIDSNLDWGQDLDGLSNYLIENNVQDVWLKYFGTALPEKHNIKHRPLPCEPVTGTIAISVTCLQGRNGPSCYRWLKNHEPIERIGYSIFIYKIDDPPRE
jgi:hypothetical protein